MRMNHSTLAMADKHHNKQQRQHGPGTNIPAHAAVE